jgi:hypothetical protein
MHSVCAEHFIHSLPLQFFHFEIRIHVFAVHLSKRCYKVSERILYLKVGTVRVF